MRTKETVEAQLERFHVGRPFYYYNGGITVCLLRDNDGVTARGLSICSPRDQFVKKTGRAKALGRALQALHNRGSVGEVLPDRFDHLDEYVGDDFVEYAALLWTVCNEFDNDESRSFKATYRPILTEKEEKLINGNKQHNSA